MKPELQCINQGFNLLKKNLDLYLIALLLSLIFASIPVVGFIFLFIYFGFELSLPKILDQSSNSKRYKNIFDITIKNTSRILFPLIISLILLGILIAFIAILSEGNFSGISQMQGLIFNLVFAIIISFGIFTPIYFSIEKFTLIRSIIGSFKLSSKHLTYIFVIIVIQLISSFLGGWLFQISGGMILSTLITTFIQLVIIASSYEYYKKIS